MFKLTVIQPFGDHKTGDEITDQTEVAAILADHRQSYVVKVALPPAKGTQEKN